MPTTEKSVKAKMFFEKNNKSISLKKGINL